MDLKARQSLQQRLLMAPNLTLALHILRIPTMELQTFLQQQVEENPLLEFDGEPDQEVSEAPEAAVQEGESNGPSLDEDWSDPWRAGGESEAPDQEERHSFMGQDIWQAQPALSLQDTLAIQWGCLASCEGQRRLGEALLQRLDENGYLTEPLEDIAQELQVESQELEAVLKLIQRLDPPGIGARTLRECLLLQLERRLPDPTLNGATPPQASPDEPQVRLAHRILQDHFELFVRHRPAALARATGASEEELQRACALLRRLNPKPGRALSGGVSPSLVPDLVIRKRERHYDVELNDESLPLLRINHRYHRMLQDADTPGDVKTFLQERFRRAGWILKAIEERNATLLAIARCLISLQPEFLERGPQALGPLTQAQVAGLIGRHPSTVSRAIAQKTIDTPFGIMRLEQFFASAVPQPTNDTRVSDERIKSEIRQLIAQERADHPLSDAALASRLKERQIAVARRTIAKYRTSLRILPAHLRRRRL